jgi:parallel beta-helix repeat protein
LLSTVSSAYTNISTCQGITTTGDGEYRLNQSLSGAPISSTCLYVTASNIVLDCQGHNITNDGTSGAIGIFLTGPSNVTIKNCPKIDDYTYGIQITTAANNITVRNSTAENNTYGFYVSGSSTDITFFNDTFRDNNAGVYTTSCSYVNVTDCTATNHTAAAYSSGFYISGCHNSTVADSTLEDNRYGIYFTGSPNGDGAIINNVITDSTLAGIIAATASDYTIIRNNTVDTSGSRGIVIGSPHVDVINNTVFGCTNEGIYTSVNTADFINISDNTVYGNGYGMWIYNNADNCTVDNNTVHSNTFDGIRVSTSDNNITNNIAYNHSNTNGAGFHANGSGTGNLYENNIAYGNDMGFRIRSDSSSYVNNTARDNTGTNGYGFSIESLADNNNFTDNSAYRNDFGIYLVRATNNSFVDTHLYNNSEYEAAFRSYSSGTYNIYVENMTIDNPQGNYQNYSTVSFNDTPMEVPYNEHRFKWTTNSTGLPGNLTSVAGRFVNITAYQGSPSLEELVFHWTDNDTSTLNESDLELWRYNGTWNNLTAVATLDTDANTFTLTNHSIGSTYAILAPEIRGLYISTSGAFVLNNDLIGAPLSVSGIPGINWAAVIIEADDVTLDCNGYSIANDATTGAVGIAIPQFPTLNIELKNCPISGYDYGMWAKGVTTFRLENMDVNESSEAGAHVEDSSNITVSGSVFNNNAGNGFEFSNASDVFGSGNDFSDNDGEGMVVGNGSSGLSFEQGTFDGNGNNGLAVSQGSADLSFDQSTFNGNGNNGFDMDNSSNVTVANSEMNGNGGDGGESSQSDDVDVEACGAWGNAGWGFSFDQSDNGDYTDSEAQSNGEGGAEWQDSENATIDPSTFCGSPIGILVNNSNNTLIDDSLACNSSQYGIYILDSDNVTINRSRTYNNSLDLLVNNTLGGAVTLDITSLKLDSPAGDSQNVTDIYISDSVAAGTSYSFNWTAAPSPPGNYTVFEGKFVDISGTGPIDSVGIYWTDSESVYRGYLEDLLQLWMWNGSSWTLLNGTPDTLNNRLMLSDLSPASDYGILYNGTPGSPAMLYGANVTNVSHHTRYLGMPAGNLSTEGGNVTGVNANTTQLTERWAAFYGNVTGGILLTDATSAAYVYRWSWSPADGGVVCVSTNASLGTFTVFPAQGSDIDTAWSFTPSATDSGTNTFNNTNCTLDIGGTSVANASYADTGATGGFVTCAAKAAPAPAKAQMLFCSEIISGGTFWNGGTGDYELMVPTPQGPATTETYYFYANLG